ncbi:response regulator [Sphingomonas metalli]|uniref:Response regulator n=1 Tax=Sphingomonas metalli TaxID=1779358 RepID=A0A916WSG6_9SPHN|nr:response regulator [Sphingomonas metalli]GGB28450.1 response regulator [Sphingomonas metalli]
MTAPLHLLYVDDDPDIRTIVQLALGLDPAIRLSLAGSGVEALALLGEGLRPDAVLLDVMMPGPDGPALFDTLRRGAGWDEMPVLFVTARGRRRDIEALEQQGARGVILKPFDPVGLAAEIRALLSA